MAVDYPATILAIIASRQGQFTNDAWAKGQGGRVAEVRGVAVGASKARIDGTDSGEGAVYGAIGEGP